ncbi:hypothetical protein NL533_34485, partial [Klebsiella pneumoniae]|nr:hypothetical protein [Klebsiella pneumoniae]
MDDLPPRASDECEIVRGDIGDSMNEEQREHEADRGAGGDPRVSAHSRHGGREGKHENREEGQREPRIGAEDDALDDA